MGASKKEFEKIRLRFQDYFEKLSAEEIIWETLESKNGNNDKK
tara:strand:- start:511 stop:639 length:129 start_codon:yes stop_codon:yes gene_type:complete